MIKPIVIPSVRGISEMLPFDHTQSRLYLTMTKSTPTDLMVSCQLNSILQVIFAVGSKIFETEQYFSADN